mmetsp:Transcript_66630/g.171501  ORF Transcript_66630/g.171501 Transcript_66630/m.171501 type:complete len:281 (+) Transcript_66630:718-1560(+)
MRPQGELVASLTRVRREVFIEALLDDRQSLRRKLDRIDAFVRESAVEEAARALHGPRQHARCAAAGLRVGGVDPVDGAVLRLVKLARLHHHVHAHVLLATLLSSDEEDYDTPLQLGLGSAQLAEEGREQRHVTQAVRRAAAVELVALHREREGILVPSLGISRHNVEVATYKSDRPLASARIDNLQIGAPWHVLKFLHHQGPTSLLAVGSQVMQDNVRGLLLLRHNAKPRVVLQKLGLGNEPPQDIHEGFRVNVPANAVGQREVGHLAGQEGVLRDVRHG